MKNTDKTIVSTTKYFFMSTSLFLQSWYDQISIQQSVILLNVKSFFVCTKSSLNHEKLCLLSNRYHSNVDSKPINIHRFCFHGYYWLPLIMMVISVKQGSDCRWFSHIESGKDAIQMIPLCSWIPTWYGEPNESTGDNPTLPCPTGGLAH